MADVMQVIRPRSVLEKFDFFIYFLGLTRQWSAAKNTTDYYGGRGWRSPRKPLMSFLSTLKKSREPFLLPPSLRVRKRKGIKHLKYHGLSHPSSHKTQFHSMEPCSTNSVIMFTSRTKREKINKPPTGGENAVFFKWFAIEHVSKISTITGLNRVELAYMNNQHITQLL